MNNGPFIALVSNVALLLAMVFVYDVASTRPLRLDSKTRQVVTGIGLGVITIAVMLTPWVFEPGIVFDTRSVLIGISGLFFGPVSTVIVMLMSSALRIYQGGAATVTGVCVIWASGLIGLFWRSRLKRPLIDLTIRDLVGLGYAVHIIMLALMFILPWQTALHVVSHIALPVLVIYPAGTLALGLLMVNRLKQERSNEAVKESEMQFRALSEQAAIGITKTEAVSGKYVFVNQHFADIVGYTREELLTMNFQSLTHPDDLAEDESDVERLLKGELHEYSIEKRYRRKNRTTIWVKLTVSPLGHEGQRPEYLIGLIEDISARKRAEEALQSSEEQYRTLFETMNQGVIYQDAAGMITSINPAAIRMLSLSPDKARGQYSLEASWAAIREDGSPYPADTHPSVEALRTGQSIQDIVMGLVHVGDGLTKWIRISSVPQFRAGETKPYQVYSVFEDITERRQTAHDLEASREALLEAQAIAHIGGWKMDAVTRAFDWSDEVCLIHGIQPGTSITHEAYLELIHPDDRKKLFEALQDGMAGKKQEFLVDYRIVQHDTSERFIALTGKTVEDKNGKVIAVRGTMQDITERKRAEAEKQAMQTQLLQSQKMEAIGELAGGVAHDFNNLLTGILGNITLIRDALPPSDAIREKLNLAESAAHQAADLTRGLLTFARSALVVPAPVCMNTAVEAALTILRQSLPAAIEISCDFEWSAWNVLVDQGQMTQIILNLGINARDAMNGKGRITFVTRNLVVDEYYLRQHSFARTGEYVLLSVSDTGPGIPHEIMEHIFEPFHTTKPLGSGTGLGLSIVYGAAKQAGGWVTAESPPGLGATFEIYLPRTLEQPKEPTVASTQSQTEQKGGTILVVEDEPIVAGVAQSLLTRQGYKVLAAADGAAAIDVVQANSPHVDLVLLDMTMPGLTTDEIIAGLRHLDPKVPILLNSGYTSSDAVTSLLNESIVQGFLAKPYDLQQLLQSIDSLLPAAKGSTG
ncbi:MAG: PAS domain S-box protein [Candidatus Cryosericum sp.]